MAAAEGLDVYDRDDPQWDSETAFRAALRSVGRDPFARAVVVRTAARAATRARVMATVGGTELVVLTTPPETCRNRIRQRGRADMLPTLVAVDRWWATYRDDQTSPTVEPTPSRKW